ncbi:hypothetical protein [Streptomyces sp. NPDC059708]|uniref:hypothetical protein n=1 Tax=Streptomyces sp. NPDC059708 TaxID=3346916 RepID=UPI0036B9EF7F
MTEYGEGLRWGSRRAVWQRLFGAGSPSSGPSAGSAAVSLSMADITTPLTRNMEALEGDFSDEGIRSLGNPVPILVGNDREELLELFLEPVGQDYWLLPGENVIVTSYGTWSGRPFEVSYQQDCVQVWVSSCFATVTYPDGTEVPAAVNRPPGAYGTI